MGRRPPLQTHISQLPLVPCQIHSLIPDGKDVRRVLLISQIHYSFHAVWGGTEWNYSTRPIQPVCERYSLAFPPCRASSLCGRHDRHSHVPSASVDRQIPGDLPQ